MKFYLKFKFPLIIKNLIFLPKKVVFYNLIKITGIIHNLNEIISNLNQKMMNFKM